MDLTYCKSQRRKARTELRNYLVLFKSEIRREFQINLPIESQLHNMSSKKFDEWFATVMDIFIQKKEYDHTLTELIEEYVCWTNNVEIAEFESTLKID